MSLAQDFQELRDLRDQGVVSPEDFDRARDKMMAELRASRHPDDVADIDDLMFERHERNSGQWFTDFSIFSDPRFTVGVGLLVLALVALLYIAPSSFAVPLGVGVMFAIGIMVIIASEA